MLGERVKRGERSGGWRMEDRFFNTRPTLNLIANLIRYIAWGFAMDGPCDSISNMMPRPSSIGTTTYSGIQTWQATNIIISMALLRYSDRRFAKQDYVENSASAMVWHQNIILNLRTCIITIYDCCGVAIVTADRYVYSIVAAGHFIVHPPIQPKQVDIWYAYKSRSLFPSTRTHLCAHTNYPHSYNTTPDDGAYNMWSICGLECANGMIIMKWGIQLIWYTHNNQLYRMKMGEPWFNNILRRI